MGPGPGGWGGEGFGRGGGGGPRGGYRGGHQGRLELEERRPLSQEREEESPTSPGAAETPHSPSSPDKLVVVARLVWSGPAFPLPVIQSSRIELPA